ncbi:Amidase [Vibrio sp. B1FLJ16]|uniref:amidase n=1 Tax=Vibrio sp. B1FLJ16 TaxID=2751178 RepID=UPI0015F6BB64|nr:amidase [Vibrio sp. B1FLJ16]CAD7806665.1 Amidase [Vibrio sp. B1FLJ16]CAE6902749.1 Amidase [Vibrio sp. B1FLJ16]
MEIDKRIYCTQGPEYLPAFKKGDLSGLTFVFKDLFDVEGFVTGAGNPKWLETHNKAQSTSPLITSLLNEGAECLGRVQTDELAYSLNGINVHYGTPVNPLAPDCLPGGSSSGSAVAVAKGDVDFSIGTDTGGSVRVPASYCGLFGLRPTLGQLSLESSFTLAESFDTAGVFSRSLSTLENVYACLGPKRQSYSIAHTLILDESLAKTLGSERLTELKRWADKASIQIEHSNALQQAGYDLGTLSALFRTIQGYEIIARHGEWLDKWQHTLAPAIQERVVWARTITAQAYEQGKDQQAEFTNWLTEQLSGKDTLWVLPTTPGKSPKLTTADADLAEYRSDLMGLTSLAGLSGFPQLHIPMTNIANGPSGVSLLGSAGSEYDLIATASTLIKGES